MLVIVWLHAVFTPDVWLLRHLLILVRLLLLLRRLHNEISDCPVQPLLFLSELLGLLTRLTINITGLVLLLVNASLPNLESLLLLWTFHRFHGFVRFAPLVLNWLLFLSQLLLSRLSNDMRFQLFLLFYSLELIDWQLLLRCMLRLLSVLHYRFLSVGASLRRLMEVVAWMSCALAHMLLQH